MSEFMEEFSKRIRRALRVLGESRGEDDGCSSTVTLDGYVLDVGFNQDGEEIITLWMSEAGWRRSWALYSEVDGKPTFKKTDWEHLVVVNQQLRRMMVLDELADV